MSFFIDYQFRSNISTWSMTPENLGGWISTFIPHDGYLLSTRICDITNKPCLNCHSPCSADPCPSPQLAVSVSHCFWICFSNPPHRFQTNFASLSEWLTGAAKLLKTWCDLDQESIHSHLIKLLVRLFGTIVNYGLFNEGGGSYFPLHFGDESLEAVQFCWRHMGKPKSYILSLTNNKICISHFWRIWSGISSNRTFCMSNAHYLHKLKLYYNKTEANCQQSNENRSIQTHLLWIFGAVKFKLPTG